MRKIITICIMLLSLAQGLLCMADESCRDKAVSGAVDGLVTEEGLYGRIEYLSDTLCYGRASGTPGAFYASDWIINEFRSAGLLPIGDKWTRSFALGDGRAGHNVLGMLPGMYSCHPDRYIIVGAHYDNIGFIDGKLYGGADSNSSGVVAMTYVARLLSAMSAFGREYGANILFVAFDAKQRSMAGSNALWQDIKYGRIKDPVNGRPVHPEQVSLMVNLDQIGSTLEPVSGIKEFIIMLGNDSLDKDRQSCIGECNLDEGLGLLVCHDYYGSQKFTELFRRLSDQRVFVDNKVPAVFFTSGITMNTNKTVDTVETIDVPVLRKRILLIFHWLDRII